MHNDCKSSPVARPIIGAGILASGGYGAYKMMQPATTKFIGKVQDKLHTEQRIS